jgi:hypothetical protein
MFPDSLPTLTKKINREKIDQLRERNLRKRNVFSFFAAGWKNQYGEAVVMGTTTVQIADNK